MKKILDFRYRSYSDVSGKYQNMEKPLKHQRRLGLGSLVLDLNDVVYLNVFNIIQVLFIWCL